jgi:hypothetical protein
MRLTGHKSREVFDRYAIANDADTADALAKVSAGHNSGINRDSEGISEKSQAGGG